MFLRRLLHRRETRYLDDFISIMVAGQIPIHHYFLWHSSEKNSVIIRLIIHLYSVVTLGSLSGTMEADLMDVSDNEF